MPTDRELLEFSEHVIYEMQMLVSIPKRFLSRNDDTTTQNALLEAFALHARQLVDFLYDNKGTRAKPDEIVACDYFDDPLTWKKGRPGKNESGLDLEDVVRKASEEIAHLTLKRMKPKADWPLFQIVAKVAGLCKRFVDLAPDTRIDPVSKRNFLILLRLHDEYAASWQPPSSRMAQTGHPFNTVNSEILTSLPCGSLQAKTSPPDGRGK